MTTKSDSHQDDDGIEYAGTGRQTEPQTRLENILTQINHFNHLNTTLPSNKRLVVGRSVGGLGIRGLGVVALR